jgi:hypothetical protein
MTIPAADMLRRVRSELDRRGIPVAVRLAIEKRLHHAQHFMRVGPIEIMGVGLPDESQADQAMRSLADQAQVALRHIMVAHEARRWMGRRGRHTLGHVETPAWGLACHPCILAVLETHGRDGEWMRRRDLIGRRSDRAVSFEMSTLVATNMGADGRSAETMGFMGPVFSMRADLARPMRRTIVNTGYILPDTVADGLAGMSIADALGFPPMQDHIAEAVAAVRIASADRHPRTTVIVLEHAPWPCAAPLPDDVDPACLSIPLPLR